MVSWLLCCELTVLVYDLFLLWYQSVSYGGPDRRGSTLNVSDGDTQHCLTSHTLHHAHMYILSISGYLLRSLEHIYVIYITIHGL